MDCASKWSRRRIAGWNGLGCFRRLKKCREQGPGTRKLRGGSGRIARQDFPHKNGACSTEDFSNLERSQLKRELNAMGIAARDQRRLGWLPGLLIHSPIPLAKAPFHFLFARILF